MHKFFLAVVLKQMAGFVDFSDNTKCVFGLCQRRRWIIYPNQQEMDIFAFEKNTFFDLWIFFNLFCTSVSCHTRIMYIPPNGVLNLFSQDSPTELFGTDLLFQKRKGIMRFNGVLMFFHSALQDLHA